MPICLWGNLEGDNAAIATNIAYLQAAPDARERARLNVMGPLLRTVAALQFQNSGGLNEVAMALSSPLFLPATVQPDSQVQMSRLLEYTCLDARRQLGQAVPECVIKDHDVDVQARVLLRAEGLLQLEDPFRLKPFGSVPPQPPVGRSS